MVLYYCKTCGRWQDVSLGQVISKALLDSFFKNAPQEQKQTFASSNAFDCPAGHGPMVQVQANDRIQVRLREIEKPEEP